jgi:hypothetical protein
VEFTEDTIKNYENDTCCCFFFADNLAVVLRFLPLQDNTLHYACIIGNYKFICTRKKQDRKYRKRIAFLPDSKARTNKLYILYTMYVYCLYIWRARVTIELGSWITYQLVQAYHQYGVGSGPAL